MGQGHLVVVRGLREPGLVVDILNGVSGFDGLQNGDDLVSGESGFAHDTLLQEHNQYVGRSPKENGPFYRDAYSRSRVRRCAQIITGVPNLGKGITFFYRTKNTKWQIEPKKTKLIIKYNVLLHFLGVLCFFSGLVLSL